jgi:hypothetical protein
LAIFSTHHHLDIAPGFAPFPTTSDFELLHALFGLGYGTTLPRSFALEARLPALL